VPPDRAWMSIAGRGGFVHGEVDRLQPGSSIATGGFVPGTFVTFRPGITHLRRAGGQCPASGEALPDISKALRVTLVTSGPPVLYAARRSEPHRPRTLRPALPTQRRTHSRMNAHKPHLPGHRACVELRALVAGWAIGAVACRPYRPPQLFDHPMERPCTPGLISPAPAGDRTPCSITGSGLRRDI
jgi:hypothetical protein